MRKVLLQVAMFLLLTLMVIYLPFWRLVNWFASFLKDYADALSIEILLAKADKAKRNPGKAL